MHRFRRSFAMGCSILKCVRKLINFFGEINSRKDRFCYFLGYQKSATCPKSSPDQGRKPESKVLTRIILLRQKRVNFLSRCIRVSVCIFNVTE
jgi:hypothetical protein